MAKKKFEAYNFLVSKIGNFNSYHPFREDNIDYEDIINWLDEYAKEYHENEMKKLRRKEGRIINAYKKGYSDGQWSRDLAIRVQAK